jgi:hypothetical protein
MLFSRVPIRPVLLLFSEYQETDNDPGTSLVIPIPLGLFQCGVKYSQSWSGRKISVQALPYVAPDIRILQSKSRHQTISLDLRLKVVVPENALQDCNADIHVLICVILMLYITQFAALSAVQEQRKGVSMNVRNLAEIDATQNAKL